MGPNAPMPTDETPLFTNQWQIAATVSSGVGVGMDARSTMLPSAKPVAQTILVPPASSAPIRCYSSIGLLSADCASICDAAVHR